MKPPNVYDDERFYEKYIDLRDDPTSFNELLEHPALCRLLPDMKGKSVLDLGCGAGHSCLAWAQKGAKRVLGVDSSRRMLARAAQAHAHPAVEYRQMDMTDAGALGEIFDIAVSSLAAHNLPDFARFARGVYDCLPPGGVFAFSQEHPVVTAPLAGTGYERDEAGRAVCYRLADYGLEGERRLEWLVEGERNFTVYHRTLSTVLNTLIAAGFAIEALSEPLPDAAARAKNPALEKETIKPSFLLVRCSR